MCLARAFLAVSDALLARGGDSGEGGGICRELSEVRKVREGMVASRGQLLSGVAGRGGRGIGHEVEEVMRSRRWMCGLGYANCEGGDR